MCGSSGGSEYDTTFAQFGICLLGYQLKHLIHYPVGAALIEVRILVNK